MVLMNCVENVSSLNRLMIADFPTPESPTSSILNRWSLPTNTHSVDGARSTLYVTVWIGHALTLAVKAATTAGQWHAPAFDCQGAVGQRHAGQWHALNVKADT